MQDHFLVFQVDETLKTKLTQQAADGFARNASHAAELFLAELHAEGDGKVTVGRTVVQLIHTCPVEQRSGEFAGCGGVQGEATSGEECAVVLKRESLGGDECHVGVRLHESEEVDAGDVFYDGGSGGFGIHAI